MAVTNIQIPRLCFFDIGFEKSTNKIIEQYFGSFKKLLLLKRIFVFVVENRSINSIMKRAKQSSNVFQRRLFYLSIANGAFGFAFKIKQIEIIAIDQNLSQMIIAMNSNTFRFHFCPIKIDKMFTNNFLVFHKLMRQFERQSVEFVQTIFNNIQSVLKLIEHSVFQPNGIIAIVSCWRESRIVNVATKCNVHFGGSLG